MRTPEQTQKAMHDVEKLVAGGMTAAAALKKIGLASSVYHKYRQRKLNGSNGEAGSMKASMLPPRPAFNGKGKGKRGVVNMKDVASVAKRISTLDARLGKFNELREERQKLAEHLMGLLKGSP